MAQDIVSFGIKQVDVSKKISFLDPAFGTGAFYSALLEETGLERILLATAFEVDPILAKAASDFWADYKIKIINADFTNTDIKEKYNLIICNPPYVRHHLIDENIKNTIRCQTRLISGFNLSGLSGLYCHFLLQSVQCMEEGGGVAGWLIPSEFMDVNYGKYVKEFLLSKVELFRVHRFEPSEAQFEDALVSSAVIWFRKKLPTANNIIFSYGGSLNCPKEIKAVDKDTLQKRNEMDSFPQDYN